MKLGLVAILGAAVLTLGACANNANRSNANDPPPAAEADRRNEDRLPPPPVRSEELNDDAPPARRMQGTREADVPPPPDRGTPTRRGARDLPPPPRGNTRVAAAEPGRRLTVAGTVASVGGRCKNVIRGTDGQRYVIDRNAAAGLKAGQRVRFTATRGDEQVCPGMIRVVPSGRIARA